MTKNIHAVELGRMGGQAGTDKQNDARRKNWKKAAKVLAEKRRKKLLTRSG